jgi:hypothetical protein
MLLVVLRDCSPTADPAVLRNQVIDLLTGTWSSAAVAKPPDRRDVRLADVFELAVVPITDILPQGHFEPRALAQLQQLLFAPACEEFFFRQTASE